MPAHSLREATLADLPELLRLEQRFPTDHISPRQFAYHIANPRAIFLVCAQGQTLLGYALFLLRKGQSARFYSLVVDISARGQGLGRQLCEAGLARLTKSNVPAVTLEVDSKDTSTIRLYESLGFQPVALLKDYYEDGRAALRMTKPMKA